jgi:FHA domain
VVLKDLGSTNGTFVNRAPTQETILQLGQTIQLGGVQMIFCEDAVAQTVAAARPTVRVVTASAAPPTSAPEPLPERVSTPAAAGPHFCKGHPKTQARFYCASCRHYYCELCVGTQPVQGVPRKFCRQCNTECSPVQTQLPAAPKPKGFFSRLPSAFAYPFRGTGILILMVGALLLGGLGWLSGGTRFGFVPRSFGWTLIFMVFTYGYLFSFTQNIIHSTAIGEDEMPPLPSMGNFWEDILLPCLQLFGLSLVSFGPSIILSIMFGPAIASALLEDGSTGGVAAKLIVLAVAFIAGLVYFPMAFLAVSIFDSVMAANPFTVLRAIFKVPLEYLVTLIVVALLFVLGAVGDGLLEGLFPRGLTTHSMSKLFGYLAIKAFWGIANIYLMVVVVRILGLLYLTRKQKLAWLKR